MSTKKKSINLAILLSKEERWRTNLKNDKLVDEIFEPKDADDLFAYLQKLAKKGIKIKTLILAGHGDMDYPHDTPQIGTILTPKELDIPYLLNEQSLLPAQISVEEERYNKLSIELSQPDDESVDKNKLSAERDVVNNRLVTAREKLTHHKNRLEQIKDISDLIDDNGDVLLANCYAGASANGRKFMKRIGKVFLSKRGGTIKGYEGPVTAGTSLFGEPLGFFDWSWKDPKSWFGNRLLKETYPSRSASSGNVCGQPCKDFDRYGFCDRPVKHEGSCQSH
ncbi:MAG: hypothetical protein FD146_1969 [Anaerolineaceae bacterium]|nr:MAG: hypothetical protein FD146_1969 [Anaerolineaceae bacterium]